MLKTFVPWLLLTCIVLGLTMPTHAETPSNYQVNEEEAPHFRISFRKELSEQSYRRHLRSADDGKELFDTFFKALDKHQEEQPDNSRRLEDQDLKEFAVSLRGLLKNFKPSN
ncbi:hypothetical protein PHYBOEH_006880 [Phytophthora boehmeriae]|uniref:RxLR effector protein n=1 Tax=Phytophthora boehmeriae TaxID=109152 RepID=A0A8T1WC47_9STRA|nr:hypothetical protein PHYBOEH_006880 [Phytophthora boehmeriae]